MSVSGSINFPEYMKIVHADWVADTNVAGAGPTKITKDVTTVMNTALTTAGNPFINQNAINPTTELAKMVTAIGAYQTIITAINPQADWAGFVSAAVADETGMDEFQATLEDQLDTRVLPSFQAGMRDINAVNSSAFMIGESVVRGFMNRDVANFQAKKVLSNIKDVMGLYMMEIEAAKVIMATTIETARLDIVASKEQADRDITINESEKRWNLEVFQYAANLIAGISGATAKPGSDSSAPSTTRSAIGGAISGAALGYAITGSGKGAAIGGGLGLLGGLLS